jgi:UDP-N-acetylmuramoylalanine--D-glutamate ligase
LKEAGRDVYLGGNIGESPLNFLDKLKPDSLVVLELSSFQLQDLTNSPQIAVVLRTTSEHLDYHKDVNEYREAKLPIVKYQKAEDAVIVNQDYDYAEMFLAATPARKFYVSFGELKGDGAHLGGPMIVNCFGVKCEMVSNVNKVTLMGKHNLENVLPAVVVGRLLDAPIPAIQKVLTTFAGLPHRLEFVKEVNGVKYYNDSFSTTPETSIAAVNAFKGPLILIAGGSEKKSDFGEWGMELQKCANLKNVILMGVTADRMEKVLNDAAEKLKAEAPAGTAGQASAGGSAGTMAGSAAAGGEEASQASAGSPVGGQFPVKIWRAGSLQEALQEAQKGASTGDNVVLSPACASFDMFKNYKERGEKFKAMVNELK